MIFSDNDETAIKHAIPILIGIDGEYIEILVAFAATNDVKHMPPYMLENAVRLDEDITLVDGSKFSDCWIMPAIIRARRLIGPPEENIPGGDGGELISPSELFETLVENEVDVIEILDGMLEKLDGDDGITKIISKIVKKHRGY
jgi:hypothetical protein